MFKMLTALMLFSSLSVYAANVRILVDVNGTLKEGRVYFDYSTNSYNGQEFIHLERLRIRVGNEGYNVAARSNIDDHICQLLGYSTTDYRIIGGGGYEEAKANIVRESGRNVIVPINYDRREVSKHFSLDMMTCVR
ncbi:MAG: hypothetical protein WDA09_03130 [Bacteriovoracaceae bacterium]